MSNRVCILEPMALACVALGGVCLGLIVWSWSIGHLGQMVMSGLVGALLAFIAWRLACERPGIIIAGYGEFWRRDVTLDLEITAEGLDVSTASAPSIARSDIP